jgi:hypothetical protein
MRSSRIAEGFLIVSSGPPNMYAQAINHDGRFLLEYRMVPPISTSRRQQRHALLGYVEDVVQKMFDVFGVGDWDSRAGISAAVASVEAGMAGRHPELDRDATEALAWMWSYSAWKSGSLTNRGR